MSFLLSGLLSLLIPLAVIGGVVYAIVNSNRKPSKDTALAPGGGTSIRRLFQYALLLIALSVAASGISGVLGRVLSSAAARRGTELAGPLALTVVGVPVFWLLGRWIWGQLHTDAAERNSVGWGLYLNVALIGSLIAGVSLAFAMANNYITGDGYDGTVLAPLLVSVAVWASHWVAWRRVPPGVLTDGHVLAGSAIGIGSLAGGAGFVIAWAIDRIFEQARGVDAGRFLGDSLQMAFVAIGIGAVVWSWHWLVQGLKAERDTLWHGYVILVGVLGGLLAAVIGGAIALFAILQWFFGDIGTTTASAHFQNASPAFGAGLVGLAVWIYHRAVLGFDSTRPRGDMDRVYDYLVSGVAVATVAGAIATLVVALFSVFSSEAAVSSSGSDLNIVLAAITMLIVGAPLWLFAWRRAQEAVAGSPEEEVTAPARRVYLFGVFGIGGAVAFGGLIRLAYVLFEAMLGERRGGALVDDLSVPIALLVTTGAIAAYHWFIYREERTVEEHRPWRDVTLVWSGNGDAREIEQRTHARLSVMIRQDASGATPATDDIVAAIDQAEGDRLLVVAGDDGVSVVPVLPR